MLPITTSVTSIKGKDHKIAKEHTDTLGIFLRMVSQVSRDSSGIKRIYFRSKVKEIHQMNRNPSHKATAMQAHTTRLPQGLRKYHISQSPGDTL